MNKKITMSDALEMIRKMHGEESVFVASDSLPSEKVKGSLPSGSLGLDLATGVNGLPKGRLIQFAGFESSGKTFLSLCTIAAVQRLGYCAYFFDAEYTFDKTWAQKLGVDLSRLFLTQEDNAKKIFEILSGKPDKEGDYGGGVLREQSFRDLGLALIVIDSTAALVPPLEAEAAVGKSNMALLARFLPAELRRVTPLLDESGISMIMINQVRDVPGQMFGNPTTSPGGRALKHACSVMVEVAKTISIKNDSDEIIGHVMRAKVTKNKVGVPFKKVEIPIYYEKGIDQDAELLEVALAMDIIKPEIKGGRTYLFGTQVITSGGKKGVEELLKKDSVLRENVKKCIVSGELPKDETIETEVKQQEVKESKEESEEASIQVSSTQPDDLNAMTKAELIAIAKQHDLGSEVYRMSKDEVIKAIQESKNKPVKQSGPVEWK